MSLLLECVEPHARPARRSLLVEVGDDLCVYALDLPRRGGRGLRRTVLRLADVNPPANATLVVSLRVDAAGLTVVDVGPSVWLELLRSDRRSQAIAGLRLPLHAQLDATLSDQSRIGFALVLDKRAERGSTIGIAGSGTRASRIRHASQNIWWLLEDAPDLIAQAAKIVWDGVRDRLAKMGITHEMFSFFGGLLIAGGLAGYVAWTQYQAATEAEERATEAQSALELAKAAQAASLATELSCLEQRKALVAELGDKQKQRETAAEEALALPLSNTVAVQLGGSRMSAEPLLALDALHRPNLIAAVAGMLGQTSGDPAPCLVHEAALGTDLPRYLLLWQTDEALTCPTDYASEEGGVRRVGRWGLSDRLATEFGGAGNLGTGTDPGTLEKLLDDPRHEDRWSAFTAALAFRSVSETLLRHDLAGRPPTLPSQAQVWALALLDAYDRVPSPASGALDATAAECVGKLLDQRLAEAPPARPGEPLLPDLAAVAAGDEVIPVTPTPGCPWPADAVRIGAKSALRTVARLADAGPPAVATR
jgi:hypothetical protein